MAVQRIITAIGEIKPGHLDQLRYILQNALTPEREQLVNTMGLIHFLRLVIIDNDTRLLFTVNFDGDWDEYLEAFVAVDAEGLDLIFSNCVGFPEGGSRNITAFKQFICEHEYQADLFYTAYPESTVKEVKKALRTRQKFEAFLDEFQ